MMRITNSMMMNTTKLNINNNKVSVDRLNTQMSTQKKIDKPSDNPLIAIKSLRLSATLSQINQYYNNNIKDAQSWMDVTETALTNMKDIFTDAYRLCVNGSTDTLTDEDRQTILSQLKGLSNQLYAEANADYANRTVFSGYKTNSTVTFTDAREAALAKYEITEQLSYKDIESYTYYANGLDTPTATEITKLPQDPVGTPEEEILKRVRLSYNKLHNLNSFTYNYAVDTTSSKTDGTTNGNVTITANMDTANKTQSQSFQWRSLQKDSAFTYQADSTGVMTSATFEDMNGYVLNIGTDGTFSVNDPSLTSVSRKATINGGMTTVVTYNDASGNMVFETRVKDDLSEAYIVDSQGNRVELTYADPTTISHITDAQGNEINTNLDTNGNVINVKSTDTSSDTKMTATAIANRYEITTADKDLTTELKVETMTQLEFEAHLKALAANPDTVSANYANTLIYLPDSGEMVIGSKLAENFGSEYATLGVNYDKDGFSKGETRPEMYFNCTNKSDIEANWITYTNYDADGNWIYQNINYTISANQDIAINTQIRNVASADTYRDLAELTDIVQASIDAHTTVSNIENMIKSGEYPKEQEYLKDCLEKAKKQMVYMDDHLQKVFGTQISHFEEYLSKVNLAITDVGSRGDQVSLAENRMSCQKTTFTELKSKNEDEELSDVTIDYTSAYTAYQASLQAAGKIDDMSLLDYL